MARTGSGTTTLLLACTALTLSCMPALLPPTAVEHTEVSAATADGELAEVAGELLTAANRVRVAQGLRPLVPDAALNRAAMAYAQELAARGVLDHTSPTPGLETMTRRIEAAGGSWLRAGENLAQLGGPANGAGRHIVDLWMTSPPHRSNLLERAYTHAGSGVARGRRSEWVAVQLYVLPRSGE
jgi:uncharacterized protein YkwD